MVTKIFPCSQEGVLAAQAFLETVCSAPKPMIILDEIASNIVRCSGARTFEFALAQSSEGLKMVFADDGKPFDPTREVGEPDVMASVEDRGIGGLGVFMVKKMSQSVSYRHESGKNILTILV